MIKNGRKESKSERIYRNRNGRSCIESIIKYRVEQWGIILIDRLIATFNSNLHLVNREISNLRIFHPSLRSKRTNLPFASTKFDCAGIPLSNILRFTFQMFSSSGIHCKKEKEIFRTNNPNRMILWSESKSWNARALYINEQLVKRQRRGAIVSSVSR